MEGDHGCCLLDNLSRFLFSLDFCIDISFSEVS